MRPPNSEKIEPMSQVSDTVTAESSALDYVLEVIRIVSGSPSLRSALPRLMEVLEAHAGAVRAIVALLEEDSKSLYIEAGQGLSTAGLRARYDLGEGIIGKVVESGKPVTIPQISREPMFLNRAGRRNEEDRQKLTFLCVPIHVDLRVVGALGVDVVFKRLRDYEVDLRSVEVVAQMIGMTLKAERSGRNRSAGSGSPGVQVASGFDVSNIVGNSSAIRQVYGQIAQVARTNTTVLLRGDSGTGKELIARSIHDNSLRGDQPFVKVSCSALPENLIESELFGYRRGAFTGADKTKPGRFELAEGGTIFLDEIGEIGLGTQVKLLRVLQEREFEPLGSTETIKADVRLITATNRDLESAISEREFRPDLYYRLNVFAIFLPPLSDRKPDILLLADYFLERYRARHRKNVKRISTPAIDMLMAYHWPGNIRELENALERAVIVCDDNVIHSYHLPPTLQTAEASGTVMGLSLREAAENYERELIQDALKTTRGNRARAARLLQTTERIIGYKVRKFNIDCGRFRN